MLEPTTRFVVTYISQPLRLILANLGDAPRRVAHGGRIVQAVVAPVVKVRFVEADGLSETVRRTGRFGSTGAQ